MADGPNERALRRVAAGAPGRSTIGWRPHDRAAGCTLVALLASGLLLASCASTRTDANAPDSTQAPVTPSTSTMTSVVVSTTDRPLAVEEEVAAKYREFRDALLTSADPPDPGAAALGQTMVGDMLEAVRADTQNLLEIGWAIRLPEPTQSAVLDLVVRVEGARALVSACVIDDAVIYARVGGRVQNDRVSSARVEAVAILTPAGWRISSNRSVNKVEGPSACV